MKAKKFDAVEMKCMLQKEAEQRLSKLSEKEQLELLAKKFGHLRKPRKGDTRCLTLKKKTMNNFNINKKVNPKGFKKDEYDVVIIGAGIGGLTCGCYLAKPWVKVLI